MTMTAREIIQKADMTLEELITNGGYLNPEQSDKFIEDVIEQPTILNQCRVISMSAPKQEINKIGFGERIMRRAPTGGTALAADKRSKPTTSKIELNTSEIIAEVRLPYKVIEDNIMRGNINANGKTPNSGFTNMILRLIAERAATDLEELGLLGDKDNADEYLSLVDGWMKRVNTNIVDVNNAAISKTMFKNGVKLLPAKYHRNLSAMRHFVSVAQNVEYADKLSNRETTLGDAKIQTIQNNWGSGVPVNGVPLMPETMGLFTNPQNLIFGIQRELSMEYEKDIYARTFNIVLTARVDFQVETEDAAVKFLNIQP